MKLHQTVGFIAAFILLLLAVAASGQDRPERLTLPNPEVIILDGDKPVDWQDYVTRFALPNLSKTGAGLKQHNVGTIVLSGRYEVQRTIKSSPFVRWDGPWIPGWNFGNSAGFKASDKFSGDYLLEFELPGKGKYYQAFCAGVSNVFLDCNNQTGGIKAALSQQSELLNFRIKGSGPKRTALLIGGDVWTIRHGIIDRNLSGQRTPPVGDGSVGIGTFGARIVDVSIVKTTIHNFETGLKVGDSTGLDVELETESTRVPLELAYNSVGDTYRMRILHADCIAKVSTAKHRNFHVRIHGETERTLNRIILPDGTSHWLSASKVPSASIFRFDVTVRYRSGSLVVEDNTP